MDDLLTGSDDVPDLKVLCQEVSSILRSAGFEMHKWRSNSLEVLEELPKSKSIAKEMTIGVKEGAKILGIQWTSELDTFSFTITIKENDESCTKRKMLSEIARIYDPLGLISPVTILSKILIQELWRSKLSWDEEVSIEMAQRWKQFRKQLPSINQLKIPRQVLQSDCDIVELHGFCDASKNAYAACIYIVSKKMEHVSANLLCSKTRVAPIKELTIPRLELCGAILLTRLVDHVKKSMTLQLNCHYWCDSQVVLSWIHSQPGKLQVFVANRVREIQEKSDPTSWHYIKTKENPADLASRGVLPMAIINKQLWWKGPKWLKIWEDDNSSTFESLPLSDIPEMKKLIHTLNTNLEPESFLFENWSDFQKLIRITAYCLRFIYNSRPESQITTGHLKVAEMENSRKTLIKLSQRQSFSEEIKILEKTKFLPYKNEAAANSRPLYPLSSDPDDLTPLTPGHFLIGRPLLSLPEKDVQEVKMNRLTRFQLLQKIQQDFWKRWSNDYLTEMQKRVKWKTPNHQPRMGDLVLIRDDNSPPMKWSLGRIIGLHPGKDGVVRIVTLKTARGVTTRAVTRICPLLSEEN